MQTSTIYIGVCICISLSSEIQHKWSLVFTVKTTIRKSKRADMRHGRLVTIARRGAVAVDMLPTELTLHDATGETYQTHQQEERDTLARTGEAGRDREDEEYSLRQALLRFHTVTSAEALDSRIVYQPAEAHLIKTGQEIVEWLSCETWAAGHSSVFGDKKAQCSVCLEEFRNGDLVTRFPCGHCIHHNCAIAWIKSRIEHYQIATCPMCKFVVCTPVYGISDKVFTTSVPEVAFTVRRSWLQRLRGLFSWFFDPNTVRATARADVR